MARMWLFVPRFVNSAHADQCELVDWVTHRLPLRKGLFLTHGEDESRTALRDLLVENGVPRRRIYLPQLDDTMDLLGGRAPRKRPGSQRLPPNVIGRPDWHNEYAQLVLDLQQTLYNALDDKKRDAMLWRLRKVLKSS